eukprot:2427591-Prymnesium_polylepis.1
MYACPKPRASGGRRATAPGGAETGGERWRAGRGVSWARAGEVRGPGRSAQGIRELAFAPVAAVRHALSPR